MTQQVYHAITSVTHQISQEGIGKSRKNQQQGYSFRGIDDVLNTLSPMLAQHKLCILPNALERVCEERTTKSGSALFYVTVKVRFDFVSAEDGSKHEVVTYGEAMDSADKATNKAMSAAYKYAAIQAFCIPTEGDNDADAHTHEPPPKAAPKPAARPPVGLSEDELETVNLAMREAGDVVALQAVFGPAYTKATTGQKAILKNTYDTIKADLK